MVIENRIERNSLQDFSIRLKILKEKSLIIARRKSKNFYIFKRNYYLHQIRGPIGIKIVWSY